jgi:hypothetical protein
LWQLKWLPVPVVKKSGSTFREAGNVRESAKCLQKLCKKFPHEDLLWREIDQIMAALKKSHKPANTGKAGAFF